MGRKRKATVDYFPHLCKHGKTMFVIEERWGNNGYAFWFKLLETLGSTEGHALDCNDSAAWHFLTARAHLSEEECTEMLNLLALLDAIDRELWKARRIVWSQNFVDGVADVYKNRRVEAPAKPGSYNIEEPSGEPDSSDKRSGDNREGGHSRPDTLEEVSQNSPTRDAVVDDNEVSTCSNGGAARFLQGKGEPSLISTDESTQSKVKDSKVKDSIVDHTPPIPTVEIPQPTEPLDNGTSSGQTSAQPDVQPPTTDEPGTQKPLLPPDLTVQERQTLAYLRAVAGYPFDYKKDVEFLHTLAVDFPAIDLGGAARKWQVYKLDKPLEPNSNPRSQFRMWVSKAKEYAEKRSAGDAGKAGASGRDPKDWYGRYGRGR